MVEQPEPSLALSPATVAADQQTSVANAPPACRWVLRCAAAVPPELASALGCPLPTTINTARDAGERAALMLGPDEWLLLAPEADGVALDMAFAAVLSGYSHSLVDVAHRQLALVLEGPRVELVLNAGVPLDVDIAAFPVGTATRTLFDKAEIVLWRTGADSFRIETARSLLPYLRAMLAEVLTELSAD